METRISNVKKNVPNILSCIRIVGTFSLPFIMWKSWERTITLPFFDRTYTNVPVIWIIVYLLLLSSDKLDGTLARKFKVESAFGAFLDQLGDMLLLVTGATICFAYFVRDNLTTWQFRLYLTLMTIIVINKIITFILSKKYHGKGNMLHSYPQKAFAAGVYVAVFFWAFLRTIPAWTIYTLFTIHIAATIDEVIYIVRSTAYNVDFKGHGFETYAKR